MNWVDELLSAWASGDWSDIARELGYPSISPSFKAVGETHAAPDPFDLPQEEVRIVCDCMQWLANEHPSEYHALCRAYKPVQHGVALPHDAHLIDVGKTRLSAEIKRRIQQSAM